MSERRKTWMPDPTSEAGAGLTEYVLLATLVALVALAGVVVLGDAVLDLFSRGASAVP
jgi:Flp pilus assembly pilin Flp